jgi:anti-anti-sigma factor
MLNVTREQLGDGCRLHIEGELALETVDQLSRAVEQIGDRSPLYLDCRGLSFIDSTGVNALLQAALRWVQRGLEVHVENLSQELYEMLEMLGFFEVLGQYASHHQSGR